MKKYYKTRKEAVKALEERRKAGNPASELHVWRMPKGSRKSGWFALCSEIEFVNTY